MATATWMAEYETLVGEGTKKFSIELTAPDEETTWVLEASVWYHSEGEWRHDEGDWAETFDVQVNELEGSGVGIPGFPFEAILFGLLIGFFLLARRASLQL